MKIIKILMGHSRNMSEDKIKEFLQKNMPTEVLRGLEYDDPKTIERALKLLRITPKPNVGASHDAVHGKHSEHAAKSSASH